MSTGATQKIFYNPTAFSSILSFLPTEDQQGVHGVCKNWRAVKVTQPAPVENGYGDFLLIDTSGKEVDRDTFNKAYSLVINKYLPQVHQKPVENRLKEVNLCIKKIDPHLKAVFIPRAVYELYYLLGTCQEEVALTSKPFLGCGNKDSSVLCWHNFGFNPSWSDAENLPLQAVELAYRLNQFIIKDGQITEKGLTEAQFKQTGKGILERLFQMNREFNEKDAQKTIKRSPYINSNLGNLLKGKAQPFLINQLLNKQMILDSAFVDKAISLECSEEARNAFILYRGSSHRDEPLFVELAGTRYPYCLSYGLSLFAGYHHDPKSCASLRMFYDTPKVYEHPVLSYALIIPFKNNWEDAYTIPKVNTICGLNAYGEKFHARAKCVNPDNRSYIHGYCEINGIDDESKAQLVSTLSEEDLRQKQGTYQDKRVIFMQKST